MLKLFVGDISINSGELLITIKNYQSVIEKSKTEKIVAHTSFADMDKITKTENPFYTLLESANEIVYQPPVKWSDYKTEYTLHNMQRITEYYLSDISRRFDTVTGLKLDNWYHSDYVKLVDKRTTPMKQLWIAGCSCSHADGVDPQQRYGSLLAEKISTPVSFLTAPGSGIEYIADQILRSDVQSGDIVVWGLTSEYRAFEWYNNHVRHINTYDFDASELGNLAVVSEENRLFRSFLAVKQVENFCAKSGAKLIMFPVHASEALKLSLSNSAYYFPTDYAVNFIDVGTDKIHPGPEQHKSWSDFLYLHTY